MAWVVISSQDDVRQRFYNWNHAAEKYNDIILEWARLQDSFEQTVMGGTECGGWAATFGDVDQRVEHMTPYESARTSLYVGDNIGGTLLVRLLWEDEETGALKVVTSSRAQ